METPHPIPQPVAPQAFVPKPVAAPAATTDDLPPWIMDAAPAAPVQPRPRRAVAAVRPAPEFEAVHWTVVALTLFTAVSVLLSAFGGHTRPRELLPVMITTAG